jgi:hypothetical protein
MTHVPTPLTRQGNACETRRADAGLHFLPWPFASARGLIGLQRQA